jgi:hypothetical protein
MQSAASWITKKVTRNQSCEAQLRTQDGTSAD